MSNSPQVGLGLQPVAKCAKCAKSGVLSVLMCCCAGPATPSADARIHSDGLPAHSPASQLAGHAIEAGISSITATNELLRGFQEQFLSQIQSMAEQMRTARQTAHSMRGDWAPSAHAYSQGRCNREAERGSEGTSDVAQARVSTWMESAVQQQWDEQASSIAPHAEPAVGTFQFQLPQGAAPGATPGLGQRGAPQRTQRADAGQPVARRLFPDLHGRHSAAPEQPATASSPNPSCANTPCSGMHVQLTAQASLFESVMREAGKQKEAARALLASMASARSGTPAWAAYLSEASQPSSPQHGTSPSPSAMHAPGGLAAVAGESSAACDAGAGVPLASMQQSLASATHTQCDLVGALQAEFSATSERVASAALELDMLQAELELLREQARVSLSALHGSMLQES
jgi:hypothetical protein